MPSEDSICPGEDKITGEIGIDSTMNVCVLTAVLTYARYGHPKSLPRIFSRGTSTVYPIQNDLSIFTILEFQSIFASPLQYSVPSTKLKASAFKTRPLGSSSTDQTSYWPRESPLSSAEDPSLL